MKKYFPAAVAAAALLFLCSCRISAYTPQIADFETNAHITLGESEFDCRVTYSGGSVAVAALSSGAAGFSCCYDGDTLGFAYGEMEYSLSAGAPVPANPAVFIYNVFYYVGHSENLTADRGAGGEYTLQGEISLGSFVLRQRAGGAVRSIELEAAGIYVEFQ